jgi:multimeric flavodoxin WrbA
VGSLEMKVVLFNGSARKNGVTNTALNIVMKELEAEGIEVELIWLGFDNLSGCNACYECLRTQDKKCVIKNDKMNDYIEKIIEADGIIIGSPTHFANVSTRIKALIDRAGLVGLVNDNLYKHKVGAAVIAVRRAGAVHAFSSINYFFLINQMHVIGSNYWNLGINPNVMNPTNFENDEEGIETFKVLGKNMAYVIKKLKS